MLIKWVLAPLVWPVRKIIEAGAFVSRWLARLARHHQVRLRSNVVYAAIVSALVALVVGRTDLGEAIGSVIAVVLGAAFVRESSYQQQRFVPAWD